MAEPVSSPASSSASSATPSSAGKLAAAPSNSQANLQVTSPAVASSKPAPERKRRTWMGWLMRVSFCLLLLLMVALWFAPQLIAKSGAIQAGVKWALPNYPGKIQVGETSLAWLSPVTVKDVVVEDPDGQPMLALKEFRSSEPLWKLASRWTNLGKLTLLEPTIRVALRNDGSNVEDAIAKLAGTEPAKPSNSTMTAPQVEVAIIDAKLELEHKESGKSSVIEPISINLASSKSNVDSLEMTIGHVPAAETKGLSNKSGTAASSGSDGEPTLGAPEKGPENLAEQSGSDWIALHVGGPVGNDDAVGTKNTQHIRLKAVGWKLDRLVPAIARVEPKVDLAGEFDADVKLKLEPTKSSYEGEWDGSLGIRDLVLAGLAAMKNDRLALQDVSVGGRVGAQAGRLSMQDAFVSTDVGELKATGDLPLAGLTGAATSTKMQSVVTDILGEEDYKVEGKVDLKRLAALLPQTLRIREGTEITGGTVNLKLTGDEKDGGRRWFGGVALAGLTAINAGQALAWKEPFVTTFEARREGETIVVKKLAARSEFLKLEGAGTLTDARFTATGDLSQLEANLEKFVDLGIDRMGGAIKIDGTIKRDDVADRVTIASVTVLDNFLLNLSKTSQWQESHLELVVKGTAKTKDDTELEVIEAGEVRLTSGGDAMTATLDQPVNFADAASATWPISATVDGELESWMNRARPFFTLPGYQLKGRSHFETTVAASPKQVDVSKFIATFQQFSLKGDGLAILEPQLKVDTSGTWKTADMHWASPRTTVAGSSLSTRVDNMDVALTPAGGIKRLAGNAAYQVDLDKVCKWRTLAMAVPDYHVAGLLKGRANLKQENNDVTAVVEATVEKMIAASWNPKAEPKPKWDVLWREAKIDLATNSRYDLAADNLNVESASVIVDGLDVATKGTVNALTTKQVVDVTGTLGYDWDRLLVRFGEMLGKEITITGKDKRPFALKGTLASLSSGGSPTGTSLTTASSTGGTVVANNVSLKGTAAGQPIRPAVATSAPMFGDLTGDAGVGWQGATVYGLVMGPGNINGHLENSVCQFAPLDMIISEGKLHVTPQVRFDQDPPLLVLPKEKMLDGLRLSPELCSTWIKYVAPFLADSAQVEGRFSLDTQGGALPLYSPMTGDLQGTLSIHKAKVAPGPFAQQMWGVVDQVKSVIRKTSGGTAPQERVLMQMPEQTIPFKLSQGRIHHQAVTFQMKDVIVRTSGSVALVGDTLDLVAEIPIPDEWIADKKFLAGMKGQSIRVPIKGTMSAPKPELNVLGGLAQQIGTSAVEGLIDKQGLEKKLENKVDDVLKKKLGKFLPQ